jgi:hypothetical protein
MAQPSAPESKFHYFSSVEGHLVPRYATFQQSVTQFIGATRRGKEVTWNTNEVVAIHDTEFNRYRREFRKAIADEALTVRSKADYDEWLAVLKEQDDAFVEAEKRAAEEAKVAATRVEPTGDNATAGQQQVAPTAKSEDVKQRGAKTNK